MTKRDIDAMIDQIHLGSVYVECNQLALNSDDSLRILDAISRKQCASSLTLANKSRQTLARKRILKLVALCFTGNDKMGRVHASRELVDWLGAKLHDYDDERESVQLVGIALAAAASSGGAHRGHCLRVAFDALAKPQNESIQSNGAAALAQLFRVIDGIAFMKPICARLTRVFHATGRRRLVARAAALDAVRVLVERFADAIDERYLDDCFVAFFVEAMSDEQWQVRLAGAQCIEQLYRSGGADNARVRYNELFEHVLADCRYDKIPRVRQVIKTIFDLMSSGSVVVASPPSSSSDLRQRRLRQEAARRRRRQLQSQSQSQSRVRRVLPPPIDVDQLHGNVSELRRQHADIKSDVIGLQQSMAEQFNAVNALLLRASKAQRVIHIESSSSDAVDESDHDDSGDDSNVERHVVERLLAELQADVHVGDTERIGERLQLFDDTVQRDWQQVREHIAERIADDQLELLYELLSTLSSASHQRVADLAQSILFHLFES
jgi:hypothetical protein